MQTLKIESHQNITFCELKPLFHMTDFYLWTLFAYIARTQLIEFD